MRYLCLAFLLGSTLLGSTMALAKASPEKALKPDLAWLGRELKRLHLPAAFIAESLDAYEEDSFKTVTTLNLLGFLQPGQHMNQVNARSIEEAGRFVEQNQPAFAVAVQKFDVPANVISSLLWIETRHGEDLGKFHIVSVYLHLLQVNLKKNRNLLTKIALERNQILGKYTAKELKLKMRERTKAKAQWAREQLVALAQIRTKKHLDVQSLYGSYAGAFGLPQFIPSSYKEFAQTLNKKRAPDLSKRQDAILSVAKYLSAHGWNSKNPESQIEALMKYNNSRDYADAILEISKRARGPVKARTASATADVDAGP
jgi:membrane-bound lytic murein transglycosylase B